MKDINPAQAAPQQYPGLPSFSLTIPSLSPSYYQHAQDPHPSHQRLLMLAMEEDRKSRELQALKERREEEEKGLRLQKELENRREEKLEVERKLGAEKKR